MNLSSKASPLVIPGFWRLAESSGSTKEARPCSTCGVGRNMEGQSVASYSRARKRPVLRIVFPNSDKKFKDSDADVITYLSLKV